MNDPSATTATASTPRIFPILLVNFIGTLGYSLILPFLVVLVVKFGGNELIYGVLGATYSSFQFLGAPILGRWSDKIGRRKILLLSQIGTFIAWVCFLIALLLPQTELVSLEKGWLGMVVISVPLLMLFLARALDGITGGNVSVANAYLSDVSTDQTRKANFGKMGAAANMGFIVGPVLAGLLGATAMEEIPPVIAAMVISLVAIFVIFFRLPESNICAVVKPKGAHSNRKVFGLEHKECHKLEGADRLTFSGVLKLPRIPFFLLMYFLMVLSFNFFYVSFPMYAVKGLEWSVLKLGIFFSIMGFMMMLVQGPLLGWLSKKVNEPPLILVGSLLLAGSFLVYFLDNEYLMYGGAALYAMGNGLMWPSFLSLLSQQAGSEYQGAVQGYASSSGSLASIVGLVSGGFIFANLGTLTFLIPACLMGVIFVFALRFLKSTNPNPRT